jgi:FtsP/CotA-like multicopper oxidase with cupredoxin domain
MGLAISDKMYKEDGSQFFPAFPGDPYYDDFINSEGANFPYGKPSVLAEFFGDFMTVNGKIWPKMDVEPRLYRLRLLNN